MDVKPDERQLRAPALNWFSQKATFRNGPSFLTPALYMEKGPGLTPFPSVYLKFQVKPEGEKNWKKMLQVLQRRVFGRV